MKTIIIEQSEKLNSTDAIETISLLKVNTFSVIGSTTYFLLIVPILAGILLAVNFILAPHNPYKEKRNIFECGFTSFTGQNRMPFTISFLLFGMLFLIFDLELLLGFPYALTIKTNESYGLVLFIMFLLMLTAGFVYEIGKKALYIDSRQTTAAEKAQNNKNNSVLT